MSDYPNQSGSISTEKRAKSVEEAVSAALTELGIAEADAVIEIVQEPSKGLFGIGAKDAVVKVTKKAAAAPVYSEPAVEMKAKEGVKPAEAKPVAEKTEAKPKAEKKKAEATPEAAEDAKKFISDILSAMGLNAEVKAELDGDVVNVEVEGDSMGIVIGKRGDTLDSLQYLTSLVVNRNSDDYIKVSIDTENYREKRREALIALSDRLAAKVARTGRKFALEPMNPYERRIIHANLQDNEDVTTFSVGQEPYRKVVIAPKFQKKSYSKGGNRNRSRRQREEKPEASAASSVTYKADFKPQQHKAEYKNFEEYLAAHSND